MGPIQAIPRVHCQRMNWLTRTTLSLGVAAALGMVLLDWELLWHLQSVSQNLRKIEDLQVLALLLFGIAGLYSILFLAAPFLSAQVMKRQTDRVVASIKDQLRLTITELREIKNMQGAKGHGPENKDCLHIKSRIRCMGSEMAGVYRSLGVLFSSENVDTARAHLNQALALSNDAVLTAEIHYTFACVLARYGQFDEAAQELESAFANCARNVEEMLAKDIEEDGPLYELASAEPYDALVNRLLMTVSVGL